MRKILLTTLTLVICMGLYAQTYVTLGEDLRFSIDEISRTAKVVHKSYLEEAGSPQPHDDIGRDFDFARTKSDVKHITIPAAITFKGVQYPVTAIGFAAFQGYFKLESVDIPNSVTTIEDFAFHNCNSLQRVALGANTIRIGQGAFGRCNGLREIQVDKSNPNYCSVGGVLFSKDKKTLVQYPSGRNGKYRIPRGTETIGWAAFSGCKNLSAVSIPDGVSTIGWSAFDRCDSIKSFVLPASVATLGNYALGDIKRLKSITCQALTPPKFEQGKYEWFLMRGTTLYVHDKQAVEAYKKDEYWTSFGEIKSVKDRYKRAKKAKAPKALDRSKVDMPIKPVIMRSDGLYYELNKETLSATVRRDMRHPEKKYSFTDLIIPSTVKYRGKIYTVCNIGYGAFSQCDSLRSVVVPESVTKIEATAFYRCENLQSIHLPENLNMISMDVFGGCVHLDSVYIPDKVDYISPGLFYECYFLRHVHLPDSASGIGFSAFAGCFHLTSIRIPKNIYNINSGAFSGCFRLEAFEVDEQNQDYRSIDGVLYSKDTTVLVYYPAGDFRDNYLIPQGVQTIANDAFFGSHIHVIALPSSVTYIGRDAFALCGDLEALICLAPEPPHCPGNLFGDSPRVIPRIYVPEASVELYRSAEGWGTHFQIEPIQ